MSYEKALRTALDAALEAGELLRREFHRWGGPKGHSGHAEADDEAEWLIRKRLLTAFPQYSYRGEETGSAKGSEPFVWLVDPNDGTSAYLRGARGSSVSIALVTKGIPVLGVVYAYAAPDDRGDLIYWAEGFHLTRNGAPVTVGKERPPQNQTVILVSLHREAAMEGVLETIQPYRYRAIPSIAYRVALVAAGDAQAVVSWNGPGDWDYAGGHALLRGAGYVFVNESGTEVAYAENGESRVQRCFGGDPALVRDLVRRDWSRLRRTPTDSQKPPLFPLSRPKPGKAVANPGLLSRAHGCLIGQCAGDALGSAVEFLPSSEIQERYPDGIRTLEDGGTWNTIAGQPTDDSELALMLARSVAQNGKYDHEKIAQAYLYWYESEPFDCGNTLAQALKAAANQATENRIAEILMSHASTISQANGSLMRCSPLGIFGYRKHPRELLDLAKQDSLLTHPHPVCWQACGLFVFAIAHAIRTGARPQQIYDRTLKLAETEQVDSTLMEALRNAAVYPPDGGEKPGFVLVAFQNAFHQLLNAPNFEEGLVRTVLMGGDTDTNAAIAGALLGAAYGREAIPEQWTQMVLSCRPHRSIGVAHPRPYSFWPVDLLILAELLIISG